MPKISVITPTYNRADVLARAMESVKRQTFAYYEHVIVDDGSTDDTRAVVEAHADERVRYEAFPRNRGHATAYNRAIELATGEYVSFLDSDDEYLPARLAVTKDRLDELDPSVGGVFHAYERVTDEGTSAHSVPEGEITQAELARDNVINGLSNTMFRASVFEEVRPFDDAFPAEADYDFQLRVLGAFPMVGIPKRLSRKFDRSDSVQRNPERKRQGVTALLEKHADVLPDYRIARKRGSIALCCLLLGDREAAAEHLDAAFDVCPPERVGELHFAIGRDFLEANLEREGRRHLAKRLRSSPVDYRSFALLLASLLPVEAGRSVRALRSVRDRIVG